MYKQVWNADILPISTKPILLLLDLPFPCVIYVILSLFRSIMSLHKPIVNLEKVVQQLIEKQMKSKTQIFLDPDSKWHTGATVSGIGIVLDLRLCDSTRPMENIREEAADIVSRWNKTNSRILLFILDDPYYRADKE